MRNKKKMAYYIFHIKAILSDYLLSRGDSYFVLSVTAEYPFIEVDFRNQNAMSLKYLGGTKKKVRVTDGRFRWFALENVIEDILSEFRLAPERESILKILALSLSHVNYFVTIKNLELGENGSWVIKIERAFYPTIGLPPLFSRLEELGVFKGNFVSSKPLFGVAVFEIPREGAIEFLSLLSN